MSKIINNRKVIEEMNRYYEARAPWHDQYMSYTSNKAQEELLRPMIEIIEEMITDKNILEIACGTGNWTEVLAKRAASVVAIDNSSTALGIAQSKLSSYNNVLLVQADAYDLENVRDSFEVLFTADWWSHVPKRHLNAFLDSSLGKLSSESRALFIDMSSTEYFEQEPCHYDIDNNRISHRKLPDGSEYQVIKNFQSESELRDMLSGFGKNIDYYNFPALQRWMVVLNGT